ncbi:MAG TPA: hypothetical protein VHE30_09460 [Polyangiaceae bacterium]|nr:hypothetical protein [Polyangiaceae bacterium]
MKPRFGVSALGVAAALVGCRHSPPPPPNPAATPSASAAAPAPGSGSCGAVSCRRFPTATAAFAEVLARDPRVLGVGESHAQKGSEAIEPATRRFTRDLLPLLQGRASDLVIELMLPNPKCKRETKAAAKEQKVVTEHQAPTDQNDYVALGARAKELGIRPHALEPTCDDLAKIASGGEAAVATSLDVVTRLVTELATKLAREQAASPAPKMVVLYGGSLHDDVSPRPGREQWSFGPALVKLTGGRYVELDLVVPEFIGDSPAWRSLPWVPGFSRSSVAKEAALLEPVPSGLVLVFPCGKPAADVQVRGFIGGGGCE